MENRHHNIAARIIILMFIVIVLAGCTADEPDEPPEINSAGVQAAIHCPDIRRDECGLRVTLTAPDEDIALNVRLRADEGVTFNSDYAGAVTSDEGGLEGRKAHISLLPQESRQILFPYEPRNHALPGAYRVEVTATNANTHEVFGRTSTLVYVVVDDEGQYHVLPSESEYAARFLNGFVDGNLGVSYRVALEDREQPHKGRVFLRVDSSQEDYAPVVTLKSTGGIDFVTDAAGQNRVEEFGATVSRQLPPIDEDGSRIVEFPFIFDRDGQVVDGTYAIVMTLDSGNGMIKSEVAPVAIMVASDPVYREERWLVATQMEPVVMDASSPAAAGKGGQQELMPDAQTAQQLCDTKWRSVTFPADRTTPAWDFWLSDFGGTLCQLYAVKYANNVFLSWEEFSREAVLKNDNISSADEVLLDHEIYLMPRPNSQP